MTSAMRDEPPDEKMYMFLITNDLRIRAQLLLVDHRTVQFAVALEHEWEPDDWRRVVCIDNFGGHVHRDRYRPSGRHHERHEEIFHSDDPDQAVAWATAHLMDHASRYVTDFRESEG